ncbi:hypothetical protein AnaeK_3885 [Anaeromyxobacter sp. K]|nr:hypothetical protein AnaeK_3885 [Anaeromyxobacter sp. K]
MRAKLLGACILLVGLAACGGSEDQADMRAAHDAAVACVPSQVDWSDVASDDQKMCDGPFEYGARCCANGQQRYQSCYHTHELAIYEQKVTQKPISCKSECAEWEWGPPGCIDPHTYTTAGVDPSPDAVYCRDVCVAYLTRCTYPACDANMDDAQHALSRVQDERARCSVTANSPVIRATPSADISGDRTCTISIVHDDGGVLKGTAVTSQPDAAGNYIVNQCDSFADADCGWDPFSKEWEACNDAKLGQLNIDGSRYAQDNSEQCPALAPQYTGPGLSLAAFNAQVPVLQRTNSSGAVNSRCMTGEDLAPLGTAPSDATVQAKWDALKTRADTLPANTGDANLARKVVQHREQLFELFGERLDPGRQQAAVALYEANPNIAPACAATDTPWAPPTETNPSPDLRALQGRLIMCDRILQRDGRASVAAEAGAAELADEMALVCALTPVRAKSAAAGLPTRDVYVAKAAQVSVDVMSRGFSWLTTPPGGSEQDARRPILQRRAWTLGQWYDGAKANVFPSSDALWANSSAVAGAITAGLHSKDRARFTASGRTEADLEVFLRSGLASDRELVAALHSTFVPPGGSTAQLPLVTAPALYFISDLARNAVERLDAIAPFHDLGCRYLGCYGTPRRSEVVSMYDLVGALDDGAALTQAIATSDSARTSWPAYFGASWSDWRTTFSLLAAQHGRVIEPAVLDAAGAPLGTAYDPALLSNAQTGAAAPLLDLSASLKLGRVRRDNFADTGLLISSGGKALPTGLLASKIAQLDGAVAAAETNLNSQVGAYRSQRNTLVQGLVTEIEGGQRTTALQHRMSEIFNEIYELASDEAGLKVTASMDQARFSDIGALIQELQGTLAAQGTTYTSVPIWVGQPVSGADARYQGSFAQLEQAALVRGGTPFKMSGLGGDILTMNVAGQWQPSCALQAQNGSLYGVPLATSEPGGMRFARTGPDGYSLTLSGSTFNTVSHSFTKSKTWSFRSEVCAGGGWGGSSTPSGDPAAGFLSGFSFSVSATACAGYSSSRTTQDSTGHGNETRNSAAFAYGLRLPHTPFPEFPAGSLLAVVVKAGYTARSAIIDAVVVQGPNTTVVLPEAADVYLVVNDLACGNAGPDSLSLNIARLRPDSSNVRAMAGAMEAVWADMKAQTDGIIAQGRLLPDQASYFRNEAWYELRTRSGLEPTAFPPVVYNFFQTWIDSKVVQIERAIELTRIRRDMDQLQREAEAYRLDLEAMDRKGRLDRLVPIWALENLNLSNRFLVDGTNELARMVREDLHPMVYLRYPEALQGLVQPDYLLRTDWSNVSLDVLAQNTIAVTSEVRSKLDSAVWAAQNDPNDATIAWAILRFPNPLNPPFPGLPGRSASDARADALWEAIGTNQPFQFSVFPEDLYQSGATDTLLGCNLVAPAITRMALYVSSDDATLVNNAPTHVNYTDKRVPTVVAQDMLFTTARAPESFVFGNGDWLANRTRLLYGPPISAQYWLDSLPSIAFAEGPTGVSPFGTFSLDPFGALVMLYPDASEISVVMQVEARRKGAGQGVNGVGTCPVW